MPRNDRCTSRPVSKPPLRIFHLRMSGLLPQAHMATGPVNVQTGWNVAYRRSFEQQWAIVKVRGVVQHKLMKSFLESPDGRGRRFGIESTGLPACMEQMCDILKQESERIQGNAIGLCLEFLLQQDGTFTLRSGR